MINTIGLYTFVSREIQRFLRVSIQTLISPWINALLYIFIFGFVVGTRINAIAGVSYIEFVMPGILMLNLIGSSFSQTSSSLYFQRFVRYIDEILVAPLSYLEIIIGYVAAGVIRGFVVGLGIYILALLFGGAAIVSFPMFFIYSIGVSIIFSFLGLLVGLWAENFEQLSILNTFIITPLTFLGGIFNSIEMLPPVLKNVMVYNPFFYFVDGLRYSMTGISESNIAVGLILIFFFIVVLGIAVYLLFKRGWKIRT